MVLKHTVLKPRRICTLRFNFQKEHAAEMVAAALTLATCVTIWGKVSQHWLFHFFSGTVEFVPMSRGPVTCLEIHIDDAAH